MDPYELLPLLDQQGAEIMESGERYYRPSFPLNISIDSFVELFSIVINTYNQRILAGFCYNLSPYISKHNVLFNKKQINEIWNQLNELLPNVIENPAFSGFLEGISQFAIYYGKDSNQFFKNLGRNGDKYYIQAAQIIANVYQYINNDFFKYNTVFLCNLIQQDLSSLTEIQQLALIRIIGLLDFEKITPEIQEPFLNAVWKILFENSKKHPHLTEKFVMSLNYLKDSHQELFNKENKILSDIFEAEHVHSVGEWLEKLAYILPFAPFFCYSDLEYLFHILISYESTFIGETHTIHEKSLQALESVSGIFTHMQLKHLIHILKEELQSVNYPGAIVIWSILEFFYRNFDEKSFNEFLDAIKAGFTDNYPLKQALYYALRKSAEGLTHKNEEFISSIIPSIVESLSLNYGDSGIQAMKLLTELLDAGIFEARLCLWKIIDASLSFSQINIPAYFEYIQHVALSIHDPNEPDVSTIASYLLGIAETAGLDPGLRITAIERISDIIDQYENILAEGRYKIVPIICEIIDNNKSYQAAKVALDYLDYDKENLIQKSFAKIMESKDSKFAVQFARFCVEKNIDSFPYDIIDEMIDSPDDCVIRRGVKIAAILHKKVPSEKLSTIYNKIIDYVKKSVNRNLVNNAYVILKTVIDNLQDPNKPVNELIYCGLQGRLAVFGQNLPFGFSQEKFAMYNAFSHFVSKFPGKSQLLVHTLIMWVPLVPNSILPQLVKPLQIALEKEIIEENYAVKLYDMILDRLSDSNTGHIDIIDTIQLAIDLVDRFISLPLMSLLATLEDVWDNYRHDVKTITYLGPAFLEVLINNSNEINQRSVITQQIAKSVIAEDFDYDGPEMADLFMQLYDLQPKFCNPDGDLALVLTYYLTLDDEDLKKKGFDEEFLNDMFKTLKEDLDDDKTIEPQLIKYMDRKLIRITKRMRELLAAKERPKFMPEPGAEEHHCHDEHCCHHCNHHHH